MDKVLWTDYDGGWPLRQGELDFGQQAVRDVLAGIVAGYKERYSMFRPIASDIEQWNGNFILSGCTVTYAAGPVETSITAGYCVIQDEILAVPAQTISGSVAWLKTRTTQQTARAFRNGTSNNIEEVRDAELRATGSVSPPGLDEIVIMQAADSQKANTYRLFPDSSLTTQSGSSKIISLPPQCTTTVRDNVTQDPQGMIIWNTTSTRFEIFDPNAAAWKGIDTSV